MAKPFDCPSCGASLDYDGDDPVVRCSYCGRTVIVPETLRPPQQPVWTATPTPGAPLTIDLGGLMGMATRLKEVKELVRGGRIAEATQLYQSATGAKAEEAAEVVRRLAAGQSVVVSSAMAGPSIPVVSSSEVRVVNGPQAAQMLAEQLEAGQQQERRAGRVLLWAVVGAVALLLAIMVMVLFMLNARVP